MSDPTEFMEPEHGSHKAVDKTAISEAIYGMITVLAFIVVLEENPAGPWSIVVTIIAATCVLASAKAYANAVAEILSKRGHLRRDALRTVWREVGPLIVFPQLTTLVFVISALGLFSLGTAFWVAEAVGVLSLFFAGYLMGVSVGLSRPRSLLSSLAIGVVGGLIISIKTWCDAQDSGRHHARASDSGLLHGRPRRYIRA